MVTTRTFAGSKDQINRVLIFIIILWNIVCNVPELDAGRVKPDIISTPRNVSSGYVKSLTI